MPLPHLEPFVRQPLVFLTVCTARRAPILSNSVVHEILLKLWRDSRLHNGWCVPVRDHARSRPPVCDAG
ncbi:MAG TPA: hypothetical protein VIM71_12435 [Lacunisphaera sp.]